MDGSLCGCARAHRPNHVASSILSAAHCLAAENVARRLMYQQMSKKLTLRSSILTAREIEASFDEANASFAEGEDDVYTPPITVWAFLSQVLHAEEARSCLAAVTRVSVPHRLAAANHGRC